MPFGRHVRQCGFHPPAGRELEAWLLLASGVLRSSSRNQAGDERAEQSFAASARVMHELEKAEIEGQVVLRDAPMRAQPGTQQRPKALHRVDVDLAEAVPVLVAGLLAASMADGLVLVAPGGQARVDAVLWRFPGAVGNFTWKSDGSNLRSPTAAFPILRLFVKNTTLFCAKLGFI